MLPNETNIDLEGFSEEDFQERVKIQEENNRVKNLSLKKSKATEPVVSYSISETERHRRLHLFG